MSQALTSVLHERSGVVTLGGQQKDCCGCEWSPTTWDVLQAQDRSYSSGVWDGGRVLGLQIWRVKTNAHRNAAAHQLQRKTVTKGVIVGRPCSGMRATKKDRRRCEDNRS